MSYSGSVKNRSMKKWILAFLVALIAFILVPVKRADITVIGPVVMADGLGRNTIDFIHMLKTRYTVNCVPTLTKVSELPKDIKRCLNKRLSRYGRVVLYTKPVWDAKLKDYKRFERLKKSNSLVVAYSMFESSALPQEGVNILNDYFDVVVVPDEYFIDVYRNSGVIKPIKVLPLAMNFGALENKPFKKVKNDPFVFTILSSAVYRKNMFTAVKAFEKAFGNNPHVKLRINSRYSMGGANHEVLRYLQAHPLDNIVYTTKSLLTDEYNSLLADSDCLLSVAMGEGFSIQPREAMMLGIPCIVTNNTAQSTICKTGLVRSVECSIEEPAFHYFSDQSYGKYYKCTIDDLASAFLDVYHNYDRYLEKSQQAKAWASFYTIEALQKVYVEFFSYDHIGRCALENCE